VTVDIAFVPAGAADDRDSVAPVVDLVNRVYAEAEKGLWQEGARRQGHPTMQLELLMPQTWTHPVKEFLHGWYTRIGYRPVRTEPFDEAYPALAPQLATPCAFVIYQKPL